MSARADNKVAPGPNSNTTQLSVRVIGKQRNKDWFGHHLVYKSQLNKAFKREYDKGHHGNLILAPSNTDGVDPREFPCPMATKRALQEIVKQRYKHSSTHTKHQHKGKSRFRQFFRNLAAQFETFSSLLRRIEGRFGSSIVAYFEFTKTLLFINFWLSLFLVGLIGVPVFISSSVGTTVTLENRYSLSNATRVQATVDQCTDDYEISSNRTTVKLILDFFSGTGWMEEKQIFYGYYPSQLISFSAIGSTVWYNVPMAYMAVSGTVVILGLIFMARKAAKEFRQSFIRARFKQNPHVDLTFSGWDYSLSDKASAELKKKIIHYEFQCNLEEERDKDRRINRTTCQRHALNFKRFCINVLILGFLVGGGYALYYSHIAASTLHHPNTFIQLLIDFLPSLTMTLLYAILAIVFAKLVVWEDYSPPVQVKLTLIRLVFLRLASLLFLCTIIIIDVTSCTGNIDEVDPLCGTCLRKTTKGEQSEGATTLTRCWETYFGQNIYKLVLMEFFVTIGLIFLVDFPRNAIATKCGCKLAQILGRPLFIIHEEVLDLVYAQTLSWLGFFFCPVVPIMSLVKFFIYFYAKTLTLFVNCEPPKRAYRGTQTSGFFIIILLISFIIAIVPMGYAIFRLSPSQSCGPFRIYSGMFDVLSLEVSFWPDTVQQLLHFISSSAFAIPFFIFLSMIIYYYIARAGAYSDMVKLLQRQVLLDQASERMLFLHQSQPNKPSEKKQHLSQLPPLPLVPQAPQYSAPQQPVHP